MLEKMVSTLFLSILPYLDRDHPQFVVALTSNNCVGMPLKGLSLRVVDCSFLLPFKKQWD